MVYEEVGITSLAVNLGNQNRITYPAAGPMDQDSEMGADARAMLVSSVISASMLFITTMLPFSAPVGNRLLRRHHDVNVS